MKKSPNTPNMTPVKSKKKSRSFALKYQVSFDTCGEVEQNIYCPKQKNVPVPTPIYHHHLSLHTPKHPYNQKPHRTNELESTQPSNRP